MAIEARRPRDGKNGLVSAVRIRTGETSLTADASHLRLRYTTSEQQALSPVVRPACDESRWPA